MNQPTKDLFDDTSMTFGEHLEILRVHLIRAIIGLVIAVVICLFNGKALVDIIRRPIDNALADYSDLNVEDDVDSDWMEENGINMFLEFFTGKPQKTEIDEETGEEIVIEDETAHPDHVKVKVPTKDLIKALNRAAPNQFATADNSEDRSDAQTPAADGDAASTELPENVTLTLVAPEFAQFQATVEQSRRAVTLNVQEAFLTFVKVSVISGAVLASPWIFYQVWLFVAAGLYPHERKFVYLYGTMSLLLFLVGAAFCFYAVFPFVLSFLLKFNASLEINPQIRISEWISFAVMLPVMFGISFQLPLVMLFLERISIFQVTVYREQRKMAILVITILSMFLTPADPMSMILMMVPLIGLYEFGIKLCDWSPQHSPFDTEPAV